MSRKLLVWAVVLSLSPLSWGRDQCNLLFTERPTNNFRSAVLPRSISQLLKSPHLRGVLETPEMKELLARLKIDQVSLIDKALSDPSLSRLSNDLRGNLNELYWILEGLKSAYKERPWLGRKKEFLEARRFLIGTFASRRLQLKKEGGDLALLDLEPDTFRILTGISAKAPVSTLEKAMENARLRERQDEVLRQCRSSKKGGAYGHMFLVSAGTGIAVTGALHALHFIGTGELRTAQMGTSMIMTLIGTGVGLKLVQNPITSFAIKYQRLLLMNIGLNPIDAGIYSFFNSKVPEPERKNRVEDRMAYNFVYSLASNIPGILITGFLQNSWCLAKEGMLGNLKPVHLDLMTAANRLIWGQVYMFGESHTVTGHSVANVTRQLDNLVATAVPTSARP